MIFSYLGFLLKKGFNGFAIGPFLYYKLSQNNLTPSGGVVRLFKMLTYYIYVPLFHHLTPCQRA